MHAVKEAEMLKEEEEKHEAKAAAMKQSFKDMRTQAEEKLSTIEKQIREEKEKHEAAMLEIQMWMQHHVTPVAPAAA